MGYDTSSDPPVKGVGTANHEKPNDRGTATTASGWSSWFGGPRTKIGNRIAPQTIGLDASADSESDLNSDDLMIKQRESEQNSAIQYRTCTWPQTAALLFSEYICLAIMSFPQSYALLGLVPGLILTAVQAAFVLYTSLVLWQFCLRHPEVRDVCDIGQMLFWGQKWAWYFTAVMFLLNNTFIQGLHVLVGAKYINTMVGPESSVACQTVVFGAVVTIVAWLCSIPRTFDLLSKAGTASAIFTFISVILATVFAGIEEHPAKFVEGSNPIVNAIPSSSTTFVVGLNAFLNISYTFIGQITLPSFIAEMKEPRDFPKALWACTILEILVFGIVGAVIYAFVGDQYMTSPAFGSIGNEVYKKVSFSFMIPTIIFLGILYASVSARFVFFRIFQNSHHKSEHTLIGWGTWILINLSTWVLAFLIANLIPFFSSLLSLMSSLFDSFFGWIFWGVAYFRMRRADGHVAFWKERSIMGWVEGLMNVFIIVVGVFFLTVGTYATIDEIIQEFQRGDIKGQVFQCASNGV